MPLVREHTWRTTNAGQTSSPFPVEWPLRILHPHSVWVFPFQAPHLLWRYSSCKISGLCVSTCVFFPLIFLWFFSFLISPLFYWVSTSREVLTCKATAMCESSLPKTTPKYTHPNSAQMVIVMGVAVFTAACFRNDVLRIHSLCILSIDRIKIGIYLLSNCHLQNMNSMN